MTFLRQPGCQVSHCLATGKKIHRQQILAGHKIQPRPPIIVKEQAEFFWPDLHPIDKVINPIFRHFAVLKLPAGSSRPPPALSGLINAADSVYR